MSLPFLERRNQGTKARILMFKNLKANPRIPACLRDLGTDMAYGEGGPDFLS